MTTDNNGTQQAQELADLLAQIETLKETAS